MSPSTTSTAATTAACSLNVSRVGRFHVAENISLVEILDGDEPCPPGVEGDIVVTNLHAQALPFLRYRVGDRAVLGDGPCPCGLPV